MPPPQNARTRHRPANTGSTTQTLAPTESQTPSSGRVHIPPSGTLRLRAEAVSPQEEESEQRRVQWAEDVVNNEGMGKKSSKVCCIYHKPRAVGESSSESSSSDSSSDSDSDSGIDDGSARPSNGRNGDPGHGHGHCDHGSRGASKPRSKGNAKEGRRAPGSNAYEKQPKTVSTKSSQP